MSTTQRRTEAICPPWCEGHADLFQSWERVDGQHCRFHEGELSSIADIEVSLIRREYADARGMATPYVQVYVNRMGELTRTEARELARVLLEAADRIEAVL